MGHWRGSHATDLVDKNAVVGLLGDNDSFRIKLLRVTRDGRAVEGGNFPPGLRGMWLQFDDVLLEPHLEGMTRAEVKEYCRRVCGSRRRARRATTSRAT